MSGKLIIGVAGGLVLGVAAGWLAGGSGTSEDPGAAERLAAVERERDDVAQAKDSVTAELESTKRQIARLDRELSTARTALASAEAQAKKARAVADAEAAATVDDVAAAAGNSDLGDGQTFSFPEYDAQLSAVDWDAAGGHVGAMASLLAEVFDAVSRGEQPSAEAIGGIQQHNGPLVTIAMNFKDKLPGETVNGAFTHPAAVVNLIASTLEAVGKPLSDTQRAALERVGIEFVAEDRQRMQGYTDDTLALRRQADESELKGRFYKAAMGVLTDEQHALLRPEATRDRITADLFSATLVWVGQARPVPFRERADLAAGLTERLGRELGLEGEERARLEAVIAEWAAGLPAELMSREPDTLWLKGLVPLDAVDVAAEHQIVMMRNILTQVDLSDEAAAGLRSHTGVFVPTWRPER